MSDDPPYETTFSWLVIEAAEKLGDARDEMMKAAVDRLICHGVEFDQMVIQHLHGDGGQTIGLAVDGSTVWRSWIQSQGESIKLYEQWMPTGFKYLR